MDERSERDEEMARRATDRAAARDADPDDVPGVVVRDAIAEDAADEDAIEGEEIEEVAGDDDPDALTAPVEEAVALLSEGLGAFESVADDELDGVLARLDRDQLEDFVAVAEAYLDAHAAG
jgi:hypothetical protein